MTGRPDHDQLIGHNLTAHRGERSQQDLAAAMRDLGYKWSQATVWAVEKGERPLRLAEASDLAVLLSIDVTDLLGTRAETAVARARDLTRRAAQDVADAVEAYAKQRAALNTLLEAAGTPSNHQEEGTHQMTDPVGETLAEPWLVELCHANGCTCNRIKVAYYQAPASREEDAPEPDYWRHEDGCPLIADIELALLAAGVDTSQPATAYAVIRTLEVDEVHTAQVQAAYWLRAAPDWERTRLHVALLDWREAHLLARGAS